MTRRHRFERGSNGLCAVTFGGVTACTLPYPSDWHYSDPEHPFSPDKDRPEECAWRLQEGVSAGLNMVCGGDVAEQAHELSPEPRVDAVNITMEYPIEEAPVREDWRKARVYPPDEAAEARTEPPTERIETKPSPALLAQEAEEYRWEGGRPETLKDASTVPAEPKGAGEVAAGYLESLELSLNYGPWPVRKFILSDDQDHQYDESGRMRSYLQALDRLGQDYDLNVWRPENRPYRFAYVTWGVLHGLTIALACDELVTQY